MRQVLVVQSSRPVLLIEAGDGPTLISNTDLNNTIYLGDDIGMNIGKDTVVPLGPLGFVVLDGKSDVYALPDAPNHQILCSIIKGGLSFFQQLEIIAKIIEIKASAGNGLFVYDGSNHLIAAAVGAAGHDPSGLYSVNAVLAAGQWNNITGAPAAQSMVDAFGDMTVQGSDGIARLKIFTGADGNPNHNPGAVWWFNDFGAVVQVIDPVIKGVFQYQDLGSASQGGVLGAQVFSTSDVHDPVSNFLLHPGITIIDPVFGDNLRVFGGIVQFDQLQMTRQAFISSQDPGTLTSAPYLSVEGPERTAALHALTLIYGETEDGTTHPPKVLYSQKSGGGADPLVQTSDYLEIQPVSGQNAIQAFMQLVTDHALDTRVTGDTVDRFTIGADGSQNWGPGNSATDVSFGRPNAAGFLRVNGGLQVTNLLEMFSQAAGTVVFELLASGDTVNRFNIDNNGAHHWGPGGSTAVDTNLFRAGAGILQTDSSFHINANSIVLFGGGAAFVVIHASASGDTNDRFQIDNNGKHFWGPGNAAQDTSLARTSANTLTASGMVTVGDLSVGENNQGAIANNATINTYTTTGVGSTLVAPAAAVTGIILQAGTVAGQIYWVINNSANLITFAAAGSNVANGSNTTIPGRAAAGFIWDTTTSQWFKF